MPFGCHFKRRNLVTERLIAYRGSAAAHEYGGMMSWQQELAGRSPLAIMWLAAVAIGAVIYFFPMAHLLETLAE
jgi:hypothetical protein